MGRRRRQEQDHAGGEAFHGGLRQLARLLAAAIEEDHDLSRSSAPSTDPKSALVDFEISQRGARTPFSLSAVEADR